MNEEKGTVYLQTEHGTDVATDRAKSQVAHSGLGIASFVIAVACFVLVVVVVALALATGSDNAEVILATPSVGSIIVIAMVILNLAPLVGIGLGIAGLFVREGRRTYAALGLALNGVMVAIMIFVWWYGGV